MNMKTVRTIAIVIVIVVFALFAVTLASCSPNGGKGREDFVTLDGEYVITRPTNSSNSEKNASQVLKDAYKEQGVQLEIAEDWYRDETDIPEKEILVGDTNRPESEALKASLDENTRWKIAFINSKLVIVASTDMALSNAVARLTKQYIDKGAGVSFMKNFSISGKAGDEGSLVEFFWRDAQESLIAPSSWGPRVYTLSNGTLIAGAETSGGIRIFFSVNNGATWRSGKIASFRPELACANVNFFEHGGALYLAYRATGQTEAGFYTSLQVSVSSDFGKTWKEHSTVCEYTEKSGATRGVWEPCLGLLNDKLTCFYANDSTLVTSMQNIEYMTWDKNCWKDRTVVSEGAKHDSRDGMPVWTRLLSGDYVCVIESSKYRDNGHPFIIQLMFSQDGKIWSEPVDIYTAATNGSKAGAPGIIELPTGQIVISFQTDEDATVKGDSTSVMKTIISDGTDVRHIRASCFTSSDSVFDTPDGEGSVWTGIWYHGGFLYAAAGTSRGSSLKVLNIG